MDNLLIYIPLGILGFVRWLSWVVRQVPATFYRPVVNDHRELMTVVTPVYQEEPALFRAAVLSWLANDIEEVIAVIDYTDTRSIEIARELGVTVIITDVPGKRDALRRGWEASSTPLVALVDSDTVWAPDVAVQARMPFVDPQVGAVTTRQNVMNPRTPWQHLNDMYLDYRYYHELASQSVAGKAVSCLSGRTAIYRRPLLESISYEFMNETFWGVPCLSGDDKRLTMLTLENGYHAVLQRSACVWSQFPPAGRNFFKQRLRWARNTWRSDLRALSSPWLWKRKFLAYWMIDKAISSFTLLFSPAYLILSLVERRYAVAGILGAWWMFSRSAKMLAHLERKPWHFVTMMPFFIIVSFAMSLTKIWALCTIRQQRWLTRDVAVSAKTKTVGRTGGMIDADASALEAATPEALPEVPQELPALSEELPALPQALDPVPEELPHVPQELPHVPQELAVMADEPAKAVKTTGPDDSVSLNSLESLEALDPEPEAGELAKVPDTGELASVPDTGDHDSSAEAESASSATEHAR
ncbi:MAG TPA: glycosyltransferase [Pseudonocardia sp.]|nr:glycosyltransferase [Pseudonocardia sp.]